MDNLVQKLSKGNHPVIAISADAQEGLKGSIDRGYVIIKFTDTQGGTQLGVRVDESASDLSQADFAEGTGQVHLEGTLTLNFVKVRCIADIDIATLDGQGYLVILEEVV